MLILNADINKEIGDWSNLPQELFPNRVHQNPITHGINPMANSLEVVSSTSFFYIRTFNQSQKNIFLPQSRSLKILKPK